MSHPRDCHRADTSGPLAFDTSGTGPRSRAARQRRGRRTAARCGFDALRGRAAGRERVGRGAGPAPSTWPRLTFRQPATSESDPRRAASSTAPPTARGTSNARQRGASARGAAVDALERGTIDPAAPSAVAHTASTAAPGLAREKDKRPRCAGPSGDSGGGIRTRDLRVMSPTSYLAAPPRVAATRYSNGDAWALAPPRAAAGGARCGPRTPPSRC